ncbi:hypothetical protein TUBRATIS_24180 [Tubulinosema ratisbonensis]|uniref:Uncharacterized protein n=1 Tax=Tubulinosema ratisbonensis TaxID=291195 RepID=A0A437AIZ5_9MICR|nr:hypothetical protein TUBRATIS_24180 [Tubulinosema ratisbonensis]
MIMCIIMILCTRKRTYGSIDDSEQIKRVKTTKNESKLNCYFSARCEQNELQPINFNYNTTNDHFSEFQTLGVLEGFTNNQFSNVTDNTENDDSLEPHTSSFLNNSHKNKKSFIVKQKSFKLSCDTQSESDVVIIYNLSDLIKEQRVQFDVEATNFSLIRIKEDIFKPGINDFIDKFGINTFFREFTTKYEPIDQIETLKIVQKNNERRNISVRISYLYRVKGLSLYSPFVLYLCNIIYTLEKRFSLRLKNIFGFVVQLNSTVPCNMLKYFKEDKIKYFTFFYDNYITSSFIQNCFKEEIEILGQFENLKEIVSVAIKKFNEFFNNYIKTIPRLYDSKFRLYFRRVNNYCFSINQTRSRNFLQVWLIDLFNNNTNSVLLILFLELKYLIESIMHYEKFLFFPKRFHFFFSLLIYKLCFNLPRLKYEFNKLKTKQNFLFTDSKYINMFVLEIRCMMTAFNISVLLDKDQLKLIFYKSFISYVRLISPNLLNCILFDEFTNFESFKGYSKQIRVSCIPTTNFNSNRSNGSNVLENAKIEFLNPVLIQLSYFGLYHKQKMDIMVEIAVLNNESSGLQSENFNNIEKITNMLSEYFENFE